MTRFFAHSLEGHPASDWQDLLSHLEGASVLAGRFAAAFDAGDWGRLAGLWHDLGKYRPAFQEYIRGRRERAQHAVVGALLAQSKAERSPDEWLALGFTIAGHHTGLPDHRDAKGDLVTRLKETRPLLSEALPHIPEELRNLDLPKLPERFRVSGRRRTEARRKMRSFELWIRFLFSALVDADFLETEAFYRPGERALHTADFDDVGTLRERLDTYVDELAAKARRSDVNRLRAKVLLACREEAVRPPGIFSLTVPTGGGKTLASMSFALNHAVRHGLHRVIAVIPFTSIIEQNADVYRKALGDANVIEHHSNLDPAKENRRNKLASENWDAPIVVTTGVQFFESLMACRSARCRKLHNIARSVVLLDEVQTLPVDFQVTILEVLSELRDHYGCTIVLTTATQPAFEYRPEDDFHHGLQDVWKIVSDPKELSQGIERYRVEWPDPKAGPLHWNELAESLLEHDQVLTVVHRRQDARDLAMLLPKAGRFHLSTLMCASHRSSVLGRVKETLEAQRPCRLVSTQLIEAGVDIDFPIAYRALGGLDSLVQAAGRCNREGKLDFGRLVVFEAPTQPPSGTPEKGLETMKALLRHYDGQVELTDPEKVKEYFQMLFTTTQPDPRRIQAEREQLKFKTVARKFRLIDDSTRAIVVPYGESEKRLQRLRVEGPTRATLRGLQPFVVGVRESHLDRLEAAQAVELVHDAVYVLTPAFEHLYDPEFGLILS